MAERYFEFDQLCETDFFEFSSLTSLAVFKRFQTRTEADSAYQEFKNFRHHYLALFYCAWFPHFLSLKEGPLSELILVKLENLVTCPSYFLLNPDRNLAYFWANIFLQLKRIICRPSNKVDIIVNDILTYLGHVDHLSKFSLIPKVTKVSDGFEAQFFCTFTSSPIIMLRLPNVPSLKQRVFLDEKSRPETLWNETDFYKDHEALVKTVWDELDTEEQKAFQNAKDSNSS